MKFGVHVIGLGEHQGSIDELAQSFFFFGHPTCIRLLSSQFSSQMSDGRWRHGTAPAGRSRAASRDVPRCPSHDSHSVPITHPARYH